MKTLITPNLLKFTLASVVLTILFRIGLSTSISRDITVGVITCAIVYALLMFVNGSYFGKREYYDDLPIYDVGFRFHLFTFLSHNLVSVFWFLLGFESRYETIETIFVTALIWSVFLIVHLIYYMNIRSKSIKNLDRGDIFE